MSWDDAFGLSSLLAMTGWAILFLAPRRDALLAVASEFRSCSRPATRSS